MFDSQDKALAFRDEVVAELAPLETDGFDVSLTFDGVDVLLGTGTARVRGHLDSAGYRVRDRTTAETEADGWAAQLKVQP